MQFAAPDLHELWKVAAALAIGLLIGGEREQQKGDGPGRAAAGVRTFALVAVLGSTAALIGPSLVVACGVFVAAAALVAYALGDRRDPGLTTEVALVLTYVLGALSVDRTPLALAVGVTTAALLSLRSWLHSIVRRTLSEQELRDALLLGVSALVILPLVPDRFVGPLDAVNPHTLWKLVVVTMAITALGYIAQRALGANLGLAVAGFVSGFVSSAATIAAMAARAKRDGAGHGAAAAGATASTVATFVQMAVLVGLASPDLLQGMIWPFAAGGSTALVYSAALTWRAARTRETVPIGGRAFSARSAILFALFIGAVSLATAYAGQRFGRVAVPVTSGLAGLADAHAAGASVASLEASGRISVGLASLAVLLALSTNTVTKLVLAIVAGTRKFAWEVGIGLFLVLAAAWSAHLFAGLR